MIIDVETVEASSNYSKVCGVEEQRDAVSVEVRLKELYPHPRFSLKVAAFIVRITAGTVVKTIIQYRIILWTKIMLKLKRRKSSIGKRLLTLLKIYSFSTALSL